MEYDRRTVRAVLAQKVADGPWLEELVDHLFDGMGKVSAIFDEIVRLEQERNLLVSRHREVVAQHESALEFNQAQIDSVREDCDHLVQNKRCLEAFCYQMICTICGKELARV